MDSSIIDPEKFIMAFNKCRLEFEGKFLENWSKKKQFTDVFINELLPKIGKELELNCYNGNYYYLDAIFYHKKFREYFEDNTTYAESLIIAFEHEHEHFRSHEEIYKLALFNAPLKVLVTYPPDEDEEQKLMKKFTDVLNRADILKTFNSIHKHLVICGGKTPQDKKTMWTFYLYRNSNFEKLDQ